MTQTVESQSLNELINQAHTLWNEVERTDNPAARKLCFGQISEIEKQIDRQITALKKPVPEWVKETSNA
jgi:hypothetical protein